LSIVVKDSTMLREVVSAVIPFEYYFIPFIQICTTPSMKSFKNKMN
jgi:hypothetical protein